MKYLYRGVSCKLEIRSGADVILSGQIAARQLYNYTWYCAIGFNRRLARARGHASLKGKLPKYPGYVGMWNAMHDTDEYRVLHDRVAGYVLRGFDASLRSWFNTLKSNPDMKPPRYIAKDRFPPLTFEVGRNAKYLGDGLYRFSILSGKNPNRYAVGKLYLPPLTNYECVENIKLLSDGQCAVSYTLKSKNVAGNGIAAIDLGIRRIATIAFSDGESILYSGGKLLSTQQYWQKKISKSKPRGWEGNGDGRRLPKSDTLYDAYQKWNTQKRLMLDNLTSHIVSQCQQKHVSTIVIGDLRGIRNNKDFGKQTNQQLHAWPFAQVSDMLAYKAEEVGIEVIKINERYTSRTCNQCGCINEKKARVTRGLFVCAECGVSIHADVNGAFNLLQKYLLSLRGVGVMATLSRRPSLIEAASGIGKFTGASQITPTFTAKFDLRTFEVNMTRICQ